MRTESITWHCDRCGASESTIGTDDGIRITSIGPVQISAVGNITPTAPGEGPDLCKKCQQDFKRWWGSPVKTPRPTP